MNNNKKLNGQFFTVTNPFRNELFYRWINTIPDFENQEFLEPFSGSNNIIKMINELGHTNTWGCFDIQPPEINNFSKFKVIQQDVLKSFPKGYQVAITNPPYLAKQSATRDGLPFPNTEYQDLYQYAVKTMIDNCDYVAAIIPESFITQGLFHDRLFGVVSLNCKMFEDTDCPVCLALFIPTSQKEKLRLVESDFYVYKGNVLIDKFNNLQEKQLKEFLNGFIFNDPFGEIGLIGVDNTREKSIKFVAGYTIDPCKVKSTSRSITRIDASKIINRSKLDDLIEEANNILSSYREETNDIFLTSFKGLRKDGDYRRRLDYKQAKAILSKAINNLESADE